MNKQLQEDILSNEKDDNVDSEIDFPKKRGIMNVVNSMKTQLKNWSFGSQGDDFYQSPEQMVPCLQGNVFGHPNPRHHDGKFIVTSRLIGKRNGLAMTQSGTEYELGDVEPNYEKRFPNAKERLFSQLPEV